MTKSEKRKCIADQLQSWIDFHKKELLAEGSVTADDQHIYRPPCWPTIGQLKEWIKALRYSDDPCSWVEDGRGFWDSGCGKGETEAEDPFLMDWEYCPYCGGDILRITGATGELRTG